MHYIDGDEFLDIGTAEELAEKYNVKKKTVYYWSSPAKRRRTKKGKVAVRIDE